MGGRAGGQVGAGWVSWRVWRAQRGMLRPATAPEHTVARWARRFVGGWMGERTAWADAWSATRLGSEMGRAVWLVLA
jgi:hypothetical protein